MNQMKRILFSLAITLVSFAMSAQPSAVTDTMGIAVSVSEYLHGELSGVRVSSYDGNVNGAFNVGIRGVNSLRADNQPLWVVDGVILGNATNSNRDAFWQTELYGEGAYTPYINPLLFLSTYDIESIKVLKDASATALYGARGANGVIIVNTRKSSNDELAISLNSNVGYGHNHQLSVNGERNNMSYNVSAFYRDSRGSLNESRSDYGGLKLNLQTQASKVFHFGFNTIFSMGRVSAPTAVAYFGQPSMSLALRSEELSPETNVELWKDGHDDVSDEYRVISSADFKVNFTKNLYWKTTIGLDYQNLNRNIWYGKETTFGANVNGAAATLNSMLMNYNVRSNLTFLRYFNQKHYVNAEIGVEALGKMYRFNTLSGSDFVVEDMKGNSMALMSSDPKSHKFIQNYFSEGLFATVGYDYNSVTGITAAVRADVSRRYNDWTPSIYPSVEAYLDIRRLAFPSCKAVSALKLKAGYGISGNELYVPYELSGNYLAGEYLSLDKDGAVYCDGLNTVRSSEWHVTAETGFWNGRVGLSASYYDRTTEDRFAFYMFGEKGPVYWDWSERRKEYERVGSMFNRGVESDWFVKAVQKKNISLSMRGNVTYNLNRVTSISVDDALGKLVGSGLTATANVCGFSVGSLCGFESDDAGNPKDRNGDGKLNDYDKIVLASAQPKIFGSLGATLDLYGLTADVFFDASAGNHILNLNRMAEDKTGYVTEKYLEKGDFVRLSHISLSYRLPFKIPFIKSISLRLTGRNLFVLTGYSGENPDVDCYGMSVLTSGMDYGSYPLRKEIMGGISIKF